MTNKNRSYFVSKNEKNNFIKYTQLSIYTYQQPEKKLNGKYKERNIISKANNNRLKRKFETKLYGYLLKKQKNFENKGY